MELYEALTTAGTTRRFRPDPVADEILFRALDAARFAPSGGNRQGWRVIVIKNAAMRRAIRDLYQQPWQDYIARWYPLPPGAAVPPKLQQSNQFAERLDEAPVHLIVCVHLNALTVTDAQLDRPSIVGGASVYPFVQNLLLALHNEGLGAALTTLLIPREPELRPLLGIPDDFAVAAFIPVGYPETGGKPTKLFRRPVQQFAFRERFDGESLTP